VQNDNPWFIEGSSKARIVTHTPDPEAAMGYIARVTSKDQNNPKVERLLKYCAKHGHWSVFEQASMTLEVVTPLAIAVQLLRHRSFTFQQFSGRYEDQQVMKDHTQDLSAFMDMFYIPEQARLADPANRQNSVLVDDPELNDKMQNLMMGAYSHCILAYNELLEQGVAKEIARFVLPQGVFSRVYVTGSCRSWIHYIRTRGEDGVSQFEHCELARCVQTAFSNVFPTVYRSIDWRDSEPTEIEQLRAQLVEALSEIATLKAQMSNRI
jgi:thymidylate synthase (FAD)